VLVRGVVVEDGVDLLPAGTARLDGVEEADELLVAVPLHVAADDGAVEHVQRGEQRGGAVPLVVVGHRAGAALLHRQAGLGAVERLDLALLVDREHDGVRRRVDIEPDHVAQLLDELRIVRELELPDPVRLQAVGAPDALDRTGADAGRLGHHGRVQWVVSPAGSVSVSATTRSATSGPSGGTRDGRVLSRSSPSTPGHEARLPAPDAGLGLAGPAHDLGRPEAVGGRQNDPGPPDVLLRAVPIRDDRWWFVTPALTRLEAQLTALDLSARREAAAAAAVAKVTAAAEDRFEAAARPTGRRRTNSARSSTE
jgi:hypothetical protein